jgi:hypothetical protein
LSLIIFGDKFIQLEVFLKQATNLKSLTISSNIEVLSVTSPSERFITPSFPYLEVFRFNFECSLLFDENGMTDKFEQCQNDF